MSLFGDLKRIFFGAKAVTKNQARRAGDAASEAADDLGHQAAEFVDRTGDQLSQTADDLSKRGKDALSDLTEKIWTEGEHAAQRGRELKDKAEDWLAEKTADPLPHVPPTGQEPADSDISHFATPEQPTTPLHAPSERRPVEEIDFEADAVVPPTSAAPKQPSAFGEAANQGLDAAARAGLAAKDKLKDVSERVGKEVLDKGGKLLDRAAEKGADLKGKLDELADKADAAVKREEMDEQIRKAKEAAEVAAARAKSFNYKEEKRDAGDSLLSGTDSFFDRADRFAKGDYHDDGGKQIKISKDPDHTPRKKEGTLPGFEDRDGDGDELIDDAIIEE